MCIPTRVVTHPALTTTAGFLRANIARVAKARPPALPPVQQRKFYSMKPNNGCTSAGARETPACPVITYVSILTLFSVILLTNVHHHQDEPSR